MFSEASSGGSDLRKRLVKSQPDEGATQSLLQKPTRKADVHSLRKAEAIESSLAKVCTVYILIPLL
jgi:hypothetical protein